MAIYLLHDNSKWQILVKIGENQSNLKSVYFWNEKALNDNHNHNDYKGDHNHNGNRDFQNIFEYVDNVGVSLIVNHFFTILLLAASQLHTFISVKSNIFCFLVSFPCIENCFVIIKEIEVCKVFISLVLVLIFWSLFNWF